MATAAEKQAERMARALILLDKEEDLEHLEHTEEMEALEHLAAADPAVRMALQNIRSKGKTAKQVENFRAGITAASVTLKIVRTLTVGASHLVDGSNNPVALPAPVFGCLERASNYTRVISAFLPKDGSVLLKSFALTADAQSILLTYKNAGDTIEETVLITSTNAVYTNLIQGLNAAAFTIIKPRMILQDATYAAQFDQSLGIFHGSMFTLSTNDSINPNEYKTDYLSDDKVRILQDALPVDPEKTLVPMIIAAAGGEGSSFYFSIVCPLQEFRKFSEYANSEKK